MGAGGGGGEIRQILFLTSGMQNKGFNWTKMNKFIPDRKNTTVMAFGKLI